ncbi:ubiquitin thioesterase OTUB1 [Ixodes scapularis]|uniref:Ubiquitin thioesterase n=1 Tax=Ixodes scapularis TaxID=6945 RepID=B7QJ34_IXOSC|nr:ubiquitin thioesterase OTUB1 [Ixodes scapularis]EEC18856.1 OTU domain, ubiquitin aldehyde binding protein, putative [Ixodes scapularis]
MADDVRQQAPKSPAKEVIGEVNHDEAILAQEKEIEREIAERIPLIDNKKDLSVLQKEYSLEDDIYQQKVKDLRSKYSHIRKTRPDGNCFFRAFSFAYLESLLSDKQEYVRFKKLAEHSKEALVSLGFQRFTIEDFHDTFMEVLKRIEDNITLDDLLKVFNDQGYSDYIVVYMRLLTSGQLQKEAAFFSSFIEGDRTVQEFCKQEVEPMYKESDHIHVISLTRNLGVGVRIQYMDRGVGGKVNAHDFPEDREPRIHLLYRPGHYDILYEG